MLKFLIVTACSLCLKSVGFCAAHVYQHHGIDMACPWEKCSGFRVPEFSDQEFYEQFVQGIESGVVTKSPACASGADMIYVNMRTDFVGSLSDKQRVMNNPYFMMNDIDFLNCLKTLQDISNIEVENYFKARIAFFQQLLVTLNGDHMSREGSMSATIPAKQEC